MILLQFKIKSESDRVSISQIKKVIEQIRRMFGPVPHDYKYRSKETLTQLFFQDEKNYKNFLDRFKIQINPTFQTNVGMKGMILFEFQEYKK